MPPAVQIGCTPGAVALINTQTIAGPYHFMHVLLGSDIDTAVFVDRKGIADPAITRGFGCLIFSALAVIKPHPMKCAEVATYRNDVAMFGGSNKPAVIGHAEPHHRPCHLTRELELTFLNNA